MRVVLRLAQMLWKRTYVNFDNFGGKVTKQQPPACVVVLCKRRKNTLILRDFAVYSASATWKWLIINLLGICCSWNFSTFPHYLFRIVPNGVTEAQLCPKPHQATSTLASWQNYHKCMRTMEHLKETQAKLKQKKTHKKHEMLSY